MAVEPLSLRDVIEVLIGAVTFHLSSTSCPTLFYSGYFKMVVTESLKGASCSVSVGQTATRLLLQQVPRLHCSCHIPPPPPAMSLGHDQQWNSGLHVRGQYPWPHCPGWSWSMLLVFIVFTSKFQGASWNHGRPWHSHDAAAVLTLWDSACRILPVSRGRNVSPFTTMIRKGLTPQSATCQTWGQP